MTDLSTRPRITLDRELTALRDNVLRLSTLVDNAIELSVQALKDQDVELARQIIADESGKQFDPKAVDAFCAVPVDEWAQIRATGMEEVHQRREVHEDKVRQGHTGMLNSSAVEPPPPG